MKATGRNRRYDRSVLKCCLVLALLGCASSASAQSVFAQGSVGVDVRRFSAEPEKSPYDGTAPTFMFGGGAEFIGHWVATAEADFGSSTTTSTQTSVVFNGQTLTVHTSYSAERRSVSALAGYRSDGHRRWRVGYYGGVSFTNLRREIVSDAESVVLQAPAPGSVYDQRLTSAIVALDVAIRVGAHLAIVPALRAQGLTIGTELGGYSIRPSIGGRVSF
jgi:outer membrane protein with beta-barrel domain